MPRVLTAPHTPPLEARSPGPRPVPCATVVVVPRRIALLILVVVAFAACGGSQTGGDQQTAEPLEVEEISLPVDSGLSTETDRKGPPIVQGVAGILPSDYPRDLPIHKPSSVSDFGTAENGSRFVELESPTGMASVAAGLEQQLRQAGWTLERSGTGAYRVSKDGSVVTIVVSELYSGSRIRIEYR